MVNLNTTLISDQCHFQCVSNELLCADKNNKPFSITNQTYSMQMKLSFYSATEDSFVT